VTSASLGVVYSRLSYPLGTEKFIKINFFKKKKPAQGKSTPSASVFFFFSFLKKKNRKA
jgi:hypothetical protein